MADELNAEALAEALAISVTIEPSDEAVGTFVLRPEHVVATALRTGRPKDRSRILQFLEEEAVDLRTLVDVLGRHNLQGKWKQFCSTVGIDDPCR